MVTENLNIQLQLTRVQYSLSNIGHALKPTFQSITYWGNLHKNLII